MNKKGDYSEAAEANWVVIEHAYKHFPQVS